MTKSARLMKLVQLLAEAYAEAVGEKKPRKGTKKLNDKDYARFFDGLAKHLTELRRATMVYNTAFAAPELETEEPTPGTTAEPVPSHAPCDEGTIWCILPAPYTSRCLTPFDCDQMGGKEQRRPPPDDD